MLLSTIALLLFSGTNTSRYGFLSGGDVSEIPEVEAAGGRFALNGHYEDPFKLFKQAGWNFVRFRIWNQPKDGDCDEAATLKLAKRAAAHGLRISLDFHYSDWWADPGHQPTPKAWQSLDLPALEDAVYAFTKKVVRDMIDQGTPPVMVQVGNEITAGMLWPVGKLKGNDPIQWKHLSGLIAAGIKGIHDAQGHRKILSMIHLDRGGDFKGASWWFDHLQAEGVDFDLIGLSYYPWWHGTLNDLSSNLKDLAERYHKDIYVVETAYPWTVSDPSKQEGAVFSGRDKLLPDYPASPDGQKRFIEQLKRLIVATPENRGRGLLYWAPAWISTSQKKTPYANLATFDYDGNALPATLELGRHD